MDNKASQDSPRLAIDHEPADLVAREVLERVLGQDGPSVRQGVEIVGSHVRGGFIEDEGLLVENEKVPTEGRGDEIEVHLHELLRRGRDAHLDQDLEPEREAILVELIVLAALVTPPQVLVEDARQLFRGGEGHDLATVFETAVANELVEHSWL